jgi:hypothetical protein
MGYQHSRENTEMGDTTSRTPEPWAIDRAEEFLATLLATTASHAERVELLATMFMLSAAEGGRRALDEADHRLFRAKKVSTTP